MVDSPFSSECCELPLFDFMTIASTQNMTDAPIQTGSLPGVTTFIEPIRALRHVDHLGRPSRSGRE